MLWLVVAVVARALLLMAVRAQGAATGTAAAGAHAPCCVATLVDPGGCSGGSEAEGTRAAAGGLSAAGSHAASEASVSMGSASETLMAIDVGRIVASSVSEPLCTDEDALVECPLSASWRTAQNTARKRPSTRHRHSRASRNMLRSGSNLV